VDDCKAARLNQQNRLIAIMLGRLEMDPDRLASQHELAGAYDDNGQTKEAVALLEHVDKVQETTLAATHPFRLLSERGLAHMQIRL
jgi:hypothetical protein